MYYTNAVSPSVSTLSVLSLETGIGRGPCSSAYISVSRPPFLVVPLSNPHPRRTFTMPNISKHLPQEILELMDYVRISPPDATEYLSSLSVNELLRSLRGMQAEDRQKSIENLYKVSEGLPLFRDIWSITSVKTYHTLNQQNIEYIKALGRACSAIEWLPASTVLSGLTKIGNNSLRSGGTTDFWKGELDGSIVAIKAFRIYPNPELKEVKKVSKHSTCEGLVTVKVSRLFGNRHWYGRD